MKNFNVNALRSAKGEVVTFGNNSAAYAALFGFWYFVATRAWGWAFGSLILNTATFGISKLVVAWWARDIAINNLKGKGWIPTHFNEQTEKGYLWNRIGWIAVMFFINLALLVIQFGA